MENTHANGNHPQFLDDKQLARRYNLRVATLRKWRLTGRGPRFVKVSHAVRYFIGDVLAWEAARTRTSTSDPGQPDAR